MNRAIVNETLGRLQVTREGASLLGRVLPVGAQIEVHVDVSGPLDGGRANGAWIHALVQSIDGEGVVLATSFATFRAAPTLRARWPAGSTPLTRRELSTVFTSTATQLAQRVSRLAERFDADQELRRDPAATLNVYAASLAEETVTLKALGELLEQVSQDITANSDRGMLLTNLPLGTPTQNLRGAR
jgi:hypothetical protein